MTNNETIKNCWEIIKCSTRTKKKCPAYPDRGIDCWKVTNTVCKAGKEDKIILREKLKYCYSKCKFFNKYLKTNLSI